MSTALEKSCAAKIGSKTIVALPKALRACPPAFKIFSEACLTAGGKSKPACEKSKKPAKLFNLNPLDSACFLTLITSFSNPLNLILLSSLIFANNLSPSSITTLSTPLLSIKVFLLIKFFLSLLLIPNETILLRFY